MIATQELSQAVGVRPACTALNMARATFYRRRERMVVTPVTVAPDAATLDAVTSPPLTLMLPPSPWSPPLSPRKPSPRALSSVEVATIRTLLNSEKYQDRAPREVYAAELDAGRYHCSVRTMYRILTQDQATRERRDQLRHPNYQKPELLATGPKQLWTWDITKLCGPGKGEYFQLYVILDAFSRYVVGWMLARYESQDLAARLISETVAKEGVVESELTLHSDRGPAMKSHGVAQLLATLGITKSHSRPHVSNDNPFSESQFKMLKYCPEFPDRFESFEHGLAFCRKFFPWYNDEHYHSGIGLLTPAMLHHGLATSVRAERARTLHAAYAAHPERFVQGLPQPPAVPTAVWINPPTKVDANVGEVGETVSTSNANVSAVSESCESAEVALPEGALRAVERAPETDIVRAQETDVACAPEKRLSEAVGLRKPAMLLAHPWLEYPLLSCVPAELKSDSSSVEENTSAASPPQHPLDTLVMPDKILGVWGLAPRAAGPAPHTK